MGLSDYQNDHFGVEWPFKSLSTLFMESLLRFELWEVFRFGERTFKKTETNNFKWNLLISLMFYFQISE